MRKDNAVKESQKVLADDPSTPNRKPVNPSDPTLNSTRKKKVAFNTELENSPGGSRPSYGTPKRGILKTSTPLSRLKQTDVLNDESNGSLAEEATTSDGIQSWFRSGIEDLEHVERPARIEIYSKLSSFIKTYTPNLPEDPIFLLLNQLCSFLLSDRSACLNTGKPDFHLNCQANKLLSVLLWHPTLSSHIQPDTASVFIEQSLQILESPKLTKALAAQHLHLLSCQKCPLAISPLCDRIITVCLTLPFPSLVVGQERLAVLNKILCQHPKGFAQRVADWAPYLLACLVDASKPIREKALLLALDLSKYLYHDKLIARSILSSFHTEIGGTNFIYIISSHFERLVTEEDDGVYVAHAWAAVISILGGARISSWEYFNAWLKIIQLCFNSQNPLTKCAAQTSWIRLIHEFSLSETLTQANKRLTLLCQPIAMVLSTRNFPTVKNAAMSTLTALIYACLRPGISSPMLSLLWDTVVVKIIEKSALKNDQTMSEAADILIALFDSSSNNFWRNDRLVQRELIDTKELPKLNPCWVRSNCQKTIEPINSLILLARPNYNLKSNPQGRKQGKGMSYEHSFVVWSTFVKCLSSAGQKEIKRSTDTGKAICCICTSLRNFLYTKSLRKDEVYIERLTRYASMVRCTVEAYDLQLFVENSYLVSENELVLMDPLVHTIDQEPVSPLVYLLQSMASLTDGTMFSTLHAAYSSILSLLDESNLGLAVKLRLFWNCVSPLSKNDNLILARVLVSHEVSRSASEAFLFEVKNKQKRNIPYEEFLGNEHSTVLKLLSWNVKYCSISDADSVGNLLIHYSNTVSDLYGEDKVLISVIEPFICILYEDLSFESSKIFSFAMALMKVPVLQFLAESDHALFDSVYFEKYRGSYLKLIYFYNTLLTKAYDSDQLDLKCLFIEAITDFMKSIPKSLLLQTVFGLAEGLSRWFYLENVNSSLKNSSLYKLSVEFCQLILRLLAEAEQSPNELIDKLSPLITIGLKSKAADIVVSFVYFWNQTFGSFESEEYPIELQKTIIELSKDHYIRLPFSSPYSDPTNLANEQNSQIDNGIMEGENNNRSTVSKSNKKEANSKKKSKKAGSNKKKENNSSETTVAESGKPSLHSDAEQVSVEYSIITRDGKNGTNNTLNGLAEGLGIEKTVDEDDKRFENEVNMESNNNENGQSEYINSQPGINDQIDIAGNVDSNVSAVNEPPMEAAELIDSSTVDNREINLEGFYSTSEEKSSTDGIGNLNSTYESNLLRRNSPRTEDVTLQDQRIIDASHAVNGRKRDFIDEGFGFGAIGSAENNKKRFTSLLSEGGDVDSDSTHVTNLISSLDDSFTPSSAVRVLSEATSQIEESIQGMKSEEVLHLGDILGRLQKAILSRVN
ncbi:telomere length regulator protein Rif1 [Schizosaccharomyces cryophilus OY26]|uniref:Telomere length regulator protein Rif1 n=1 Tax=Schizosaccharomyces cryophilus (strain OY26 / ATCC MYA-4695 / CBS 11777 / NBRC 106824 / NRRL Y48691) TaxID=653667 RepID=S9W5H5_SCHCR|nr:telomere length regulator protein Rif1 [Schizosaccharomyces cryophilus OY26]EPY53210.1 telomere length regulator protein Rif1 [Schizosaccharomyces cryophilus OY26]